MLNERPQIAYLRRDTKTWARAREILEIPDHLEQRIVELGVEFGIEQRASVTLQVLLTPEQVTAMAELAAEGAV